MARRKFWLASALCLAGGFCGSLAGAAPGLSFESRNGASFNEWFVRGDAVVSASTVFDQGVRLAAWDGQNENDLARVAVAAAVYFFQIPSEAVSVRIDVGYRVDPAAQNPQAAGFLFVRNQAVDAQVAPQGELAPGAGPADDPGFVGDSFLLPANQTRQTFDLPLAGRVSNGVLEVHLVAGAGQVFDVQCVQATSSAAQAPVAPVFAMPSADYAPNPYDDTYYYYYTGPSYYPYGGYYAEFNCFDSLISPFYWGGWSTWRACFGHHHHWRHRPHDFDHQRPIVTRPTTLADASIDAHRRQWLRDHFHVDSRRLSDLGVTVAARYHTRIVSDDAARLAHVHAQAIADQVRQSSDELRARYGNRLPDRLLAWSRDPSRARLDLAATARGQAIQGASAQWQALHASPHPQRLDAAAMLPAPGQPAGTYPAFTSRNAARWTSPATGLNPSAARLGVSPWSDVRAQRTFAPSFTQPPAGYPGIVHRANGSNGTPSLTSQPFVGTPTVGGAEGPSAAWPSRDRRLDAPTLGRFSVPHPLAHSTPLTYTPPTSTPVLPHIQSRSELRLTPGEFTPHQTLSTPRRYEAPSAGQSTPVTTGSHPRIDTRAWGTSHTFSGGGADSAPRRSGNSSGAVHHGRR